MLHVPSMTAFVSCCSSVAQSCPTLCDPMDCSMPSSLSCTISLSLLQLMSPESMMPSNRSSSVTPFSCFPFCPASGSFPKSQLFASSGQNITVSASASVLPMNIQGWFLLGLTGSISLLSKGFSRVFSITIQSISSLAFALRRVHCQGGKLATHSCPISSVVGPRPGSL